MVSIPACRSTWDLDQASLPGALPFMRMRSEAASKYGVVGVEVLQVKSVRADSVGHLLLTPGTDELR